MGFNSILFGIVVNIFPINLLYLAKMCAKERKRDLRIEDAAGLNTALVSVLSMKDL